MACVGHLSAMLYTSQLGHCSVLLLTLLGFESVLAGILHGVPGKRLVYTKLRGGTVQTGL